MANVNATLSVWIDNDLDGAISLVLLFETNIKMNVV